MNLGRLESAGQASRCSEQVVGDSLAFLGEEEAKWPCPEPSTEAFSWPLLSLGADPRLLEVPPRQCQSPASSEPALSKQQGKTSQRPVPAQRLPPSTAIPRPWPSLLPLCCQPQPVSSRDGSRHGCPPPAGFLAASAGRDVQPASRPWELQHLAKILLEMPHSSWQG